MRYGLMMRPASLGTFPKGGTIVKSFETLTEYKNVSVWGLLDYPDFLGEKTCRDYGLFSYDNLLENIYEIYVYNGDWRKVNAPIPECLKHKDKFSKVRIRTYAGDKDMTWDELGRLYNS